MLAHPRMPYGRKLDVRTHTSILTTLRCFAPIPGPTCSHLMVINMLSVNSSAIDGEGIEDPIGGFRPHERFRVLVPGVDPFADVGFECGDTGPRRRGPSR